MVQNVSVCKSFPYISITVLLKPLESYLIKKITENTLIQKEQYKIDCKIEIEYIFGMHLCLLMHLRQWYLEFYETINIRKYL